ncbi:hypothetical protein CEP52_000395 [Fusarium oligoseptatum]|uniref:Uncharacterized protein n=1 Tax=Fusarium oligoseptatum TaxID=2604345 RepID=A0A428UPU6_9HYPO|nr:hypothetical protein CEP52_000395 [Fusarium oligoseptatum]
MPAFTEKMGRGLWNTLQHVSVILPAGIFLGSAIALSLPRHNGLNAVTVILLFASGAVSVLLYRHTFQQIRFGRVAAVVAFAFVASRSPPLIKSLPFVEVALSCIQFFAVSVVIVASAVAMRRPYAIPRIQETEDIANEEVDSMAPGARSQPGTPESSVGEPDEAKSDLNPLRFEHMEGQKLQPPEPAGGEASTLTLSPNSKLDPAWLFEILGWVQTVRQEDSGKEDETAIHLQV